MTAIRVRRGDWPGRRVWIFEQRIHHGAVGTILAAAAAIPLIAGRPLPPTATTGLMLAATVLCWSDRHDFTRTLWLRDR